MRVKISWKYKDKTGAFEFNCIEEFSLANAEFLFTDGSYGCDCNLSEFVGFAEQPNLWPCGDRIEVTKVEAITDLE